LKADGDFIGSRKDPFIHKTLTADKGILLRRHHIDAIDFNGSKGVFALVHEGNMLTGPQAGNEGYKKYESQKGGNKGSCQNKSVTHPDQ